jgi:hypothetical protein
VVCETLVDDLRVDIHFAAVGGTGGIADACRVYRALQIPVAVITDLDILADFERLHRVVSVLVDSAQAEAIGKAAVEVATAIKTLPPTIDPIDLRKRLSAALALPTDWLQNHDAPLRSALQELAQLLDCMRRLKPGGIAALPVQLTGRVSSLVATLAAIGVFVVPIGELEEWLVDCGISASIPRSFEQDEA